MVRTLVYHRSKALLAGSERSLADQKRVVRSILSTAVSRTESRSLSAQAIVKAVAESGGRLPRARKSGTIGVREEVGEGIEGGRMLRAVVWMR